MTELFTTRARNITVCVQLYMDKSDGRTTYRNVKENCRLSHVSRAISLLLQTHRFLSTALVEPSTVSARETLPFATCGMRRALWLRPAFSAPAAVLHTGYSR